LFNDHLPPQRQSNRTLSWAISPENPVIRGENDFATANGVHRIDRVNAGIFDGVAETGFLIRLPAGCADLFALDAERPESR